jgi:peptide deformylase
MATKDTNTTDPLKFEIILNEHTPVIEESITNVNEFLTTNRDQLHEFLNFATQQPTAVGLAANQVSLNGTRFMHRVIAIKNLQTAQWRLIIDPEITERIGMLETKIEGCLTYPNKDIIAKRYRAVKVSYYNSMGLFVENQFYKGFEAQIWQHEINHLNGIQERVEQKDINRKLNNPTPTRNDACPCGSAKKYKNCCIYLVD